MTAEQRSLSRALLLHLSAVALLVLLPFVVFQPWTISALSAFLIGWRGYSAWRDQSSPPKWLLLPMALAGLGLIYLAYGQIIGKLPGLAMLSMLLPLKLLESRDVRDARAALLLACFLMIGLFLHAQSMWIAAVVGVAALGVVAALARLQDEAISLKRSLRISLTLCGQGVPLMVVLFLLFPRASGPLWGLPLDAYSGMTGLSDRMAPGSISTLIESADIAFRVEFQGPPPPPAQRYWRGPVLTQFDGREWSPTWSGTHISAPYDVTGTAYRYAITIEPNNERWLMAMDYPASTEAGRIGDDFTLLARAPVRSRQRYELTSYPDSRVGLDENADLLRRALSLPADSNPRTVAMASAWRNEQPAMRIERILGFMRRQGLQYTLYPPSLGEHTADEFLFDTRRGFCEHFASAFAVMARAAGVPARVVTGYQGGEFNPVDGTLVVRQSDAHAWTEVWLPQRGWVRIDPTAASFPQRIDGGVSMALPRNEPLPFAVRDDLPWLRGLRHQWEALNNRWNQWVLGYNASRQSGLFNAIGMPKVSWRDLVGLMALTIVAWLAWLAWHTWPAQARRDALDRAWHRLARRVRLNPKPWEPAGAFAQRVAHEHPHIAREVSQIAERYATLRYGAQGARAEQIRALRRDIDSLQV
jgi:protein-glutamine gamma-glutamyltransferase